MNRTKFTVEQTNNLCCEIFKDNRDFVNNHDYVYDFIAEHEIDLMRVARLKDDMFWMATIKFKDDKQYKHCHYKHELLIMAILGAYLWSKGFRP